MSEESIAKRWEGSGRGKDQLRGMGLDREGAAGSVPTPSLAVLEEGVHDFHCPLCPKGASPAIQG